MSNNKQSSIDVLFSEMYNIISFYAGDEQDAVCEKIKQQAKAMHNKEQEQLSARWAKLREQTRETAMHIGFARGFQLGVESYEDYYQELDKHTDLDESEFNRNYITDRFEETFGGNNEQQ